VALVKFVMLILFPALQYKLMSKKRRKLRNGVNYESTPKKVRLNILNTGSVKMKTIAYIKNVTQIELKNKIINIASFKKLQKKEPN